MSAGGLRSVSDDRGGSVMKIYRPANHEPGDHRYALVFNDGAMGIEVYDQGGELYDLERVPAGWVEQSSGGAS